MGTEILVGVIAGLISTALVGFILILWKGSQRGVGLRRMISILREFVSRGGGTIVYVDRKGLVRQLGTVSEYVRKAESEITYVGFWLSSSLEQSDLIPTIRELLHSGRSFHACLLNPQSPLISFYAEVFGISETELTNRIVASIEKLVELAASAKGHGDGELTIAIHDRILPASVFIMDKGSPHSRLLIDHKIHDSSRVYSYGMEFIIPVSELGKRIQDSYSHVLRQATPLHEGMSQT